MEGGASGLWLTDGAGKGHRAPGAVFAALSALSQVVLKRATAAPMAVGAGADTSESVSTRAAPCRAADMTTNRLIRLGADMPTGSPSVYCLTGYHFSSADKMTFVPGPKVPLPSP
ncbi:MAG: hypothetical protein BroJett014_05870 [Planctomycetota bacterium]|nr:MAG: hypothetical protein BroJett014_05870 [Planctomycetota bacterium]